MPLDAGQNNQGFTTTSAGGVNFNWELNKKTKLHASYFYNGIKKDLELTETQQSILGEESYNSTRNAEAKRKNEGHRLNLHFSSKIDSFQTIKWRTNLGYTQKNNSSNSFRETFNFCLLYTSPSPRD